MNAIDSVKTAFILSAGGPYFAFLPTFGLPPPLDFGPLFPLSGIVWLLYPGLAWPGSRISPSRLHPPTVAASAEPAQGPGLSLSFQFARGPRGAVRSVALHGIDLVAQRPAGEEAAQVVAEDREDSLGELVRCAGAVAAKQDIVELV